MNPVVVRRLVLVVFVGGIAGMIVGSIADNNGVAVTFGLISAVAALCQILVTSVSATERGTVTFDEAAAEDMERRITALVDAGADEAAVRDLVRHAVMLGRGAKSHARGRAARSEEHGDDDAQ